MDEEKLLCACNGKKCEGECKNVHLHRVRTQSKTQYKLKPITKCPEAYIKNAPRHTSERKSDGGRKRRNDTEW